MSGQNSIKNPASTRQAGKKQKPKQSMKVCKYTSLTANYTDLSEKITERGIATALVLTPEL
jgi:hypothetical protein